MLISRLILLSCPGTSRGVLSSSVQNQAGRFHHCPKAQHQSRIALPQSMERNRAGRQTSDDASNLRPVRHGLERDVHCRVPLAVPDRTALYISTGKRKGNARQLFG
ncbi:hypothetical protein F4802DRAFT_552550 [Xylaria palmicola]|nr:hypothetical protein F4802DRAFT_552550 [Xylaria palmicola]